MDDLDIWSSPDPADTKPATSSSSSSQGTRPAPKSLFDDDSALDAPWGQEEEVAEAAPQPSAAAETEEKSISLAQAEGDLLVDAGDAHQEQPGEAEHRDDQDRKAEVDVAGEPEEDDDDDDDDNDAFHEAEADGSRAVSPGEEAQKPAAAAPAASSFDEDDDGFGEFDDHATACPSAGNAAGGDDDFGDFGDDDFGGADDFGADFGDDDGVAAAAAPVAETPTPTPAAATSNAPQWPSLSLHDPSYQHLANQIQTILSPPTASDGPSNPFGSGWSNHLGTDQVRQVDGPAQVLVGESSRQVYSTISTPPALKPTDWLRSRTRRDMYISLGVPINLDELVEPSSSASSSRLPPLQIQLDDVGAPHSATSTNGGGVSAGHSGGSASANGGGGGGGVDKNRERERAMEKRREDLGLGRPPDVDLKRLDEVCKLSEDQLTLLPLPSLQSLRRELETFTTQTSTLLTHHLTLRESLQSDSETYNGLIADLVAGAASRIGGGGSGGSGKKAERSSSIRMKDKRSTFGGSPTTAVGRKFGSGGGGINGTGTPTSAGSTPRSQSPAPGSAGWRR